MNKKRTNTKPFCSPTTGEPCSAAQYVAEIVCLRNFKKKNSGDPSFKFWNKEQKEIYQGQVVTANKLINEFGLEAVLNFINYNTGVWSLGHFNPIKFVKDGISKSKWILEQKAKTAKNIEVKKDQEPVDSDFDIPVPKPKKSLFDKLRK